MAKPDSIELPDCKPIRILHEDRTAIAVDKPPGAITCRPAFFH
jgi:hypothetical protein